MTQRGLLHKSNHRLTMVLAYCSRGFHASTVQRSSAKVAVLYQAVSAPIINGVTKPLKPGGYRDSGADIIYTLRQHKIASIITPSDMPDAKSDQDWCFPDDEKGILAALSKGANILWANTILFSKHPLQISSSLDKYADQVKIVGQAPRAVDAYDDKAFTNDLLRRDGRFLLSKSWILSFDQDYSALLKTLNYPIVAKPIRGRGSHGVKLCYDRAHLENHMDELFAESSQIMLEQYLMGEEATITIMPPIPQQHKQETVDILPNIDFSKYWALPIVVRFNHQDGIAPYSGTVAITQNSRYLTSSAFNSDPEYIHVSRQCEQVGTLLKLSAPIRIDVRRIADKGPFALFDINMKPNITGSERPGRENQTSLMAMGAQGLGWNYPMLLQYMLQLAKPLSELRRFKVYS